MKKFKLSVLAMLSVIAMTFTSCLGDDGDNTQYVYGTGKAISSQSVLLDNGLTITSSATLELSERYYVMAQCSQEEYESVMAKLNAGERASIKSEYMEGGKFVIGELEEEPGTSTDVDGLSWFNWGAFGNGYVNLNVKADYYGKKEAENATTPSLFTPEIGATYAYEAASNTLTLTISYNSRKEEATESDGKLKNGYSVYTGQELPFSIDVVELYGELRRESPTLKDTDEINLVVKYLSEGTVQSDELTGKFGTSTNYFNLGMLKRNFEY